MLFDQPSMRQLVLSDAGAALPRMLPMGGGIPQQQIALSALTSCATCKRWYRAQHRTFRGSPADRGEFRSRPAHPITFWNQVELIRAPRLRAYSRNVPTRWPPAASCPAAGGFHPRFVGTDLHLELRTAPARRRQDEAAKEDDTSRGGCVDAEQIASLANSKVKAVSRASRMSSLAARSFEAQTCGRGCCMPVALPPASGRSAPCRC